MRRVDDTAVAFARACDSAGIEYAVIGGFAVIAWGQPRTTEDVDVLLLLAAHQVKPFCAALAAEKLDASEADVEDARRDGSHVTIFDAASHFRIDARRARDEPEVEQIRSAVPIEFKGQRICVSRPEETIAFKLKYGSEQDLQDARSILVRQEGKLDLSRLRRLVRELGVEAAFDDLMRD